MRLRGRLLWGSLVPALLVLSVGGFGLYRASRTVLEEELGNSLSAVAASIASQLKPDRVLAVTKDDNTRPSRLYTSLAGQLSDARQAAALRRVLLFDAERRALVDVGGRMPVWEVVPELSADELELRRVFAGERASSQVLFEGNDGQLYKTGYAPVFHEKEVIGAVAVEGTAAFFGPLTVLRNLFVALMGLTLLLLAVGAVVSAQALSRPLDALVTSALRIGGGDLSTPVSGAMATEEIAILTRELEAMRKALESRDQQLKMMLGGVAHEVRNPLGGIELFSGLLSEELGAEKPDVGEAKAHVAKVRRELDYLKRIVEDFLVYAREQKLHRDEVDARAVLIGAAAHLQGEAAVREVTVTVEAEAVKVEVDENLLTSALVNLVKNAVQVSAKGQTVRVSGVERDGGYQVTVADEGPGIAPELQARIFEPFFTTREKGTGLGLPLAKKLVEAHHGTLTLSSKPGSTVFTVWLPLKGVNISR